MSTENQYPPIPEELVIESLEAFKVMSSPMRLRVLFHLRSARSVAEVAAAMEVTPTRLYYHFNALVNAGIIEVIETRKKGTQLEKVYRVAGKTIRPGPGAWNTSDDPYDFAEVAASLVLDTTRIELVEAIAHRSGSGIDLAEMSGTLGRTISSIPHRRIKEFATRIEDLVADMASEESDDGVMVSFTYVLVPTDPNGADQSEGTQS